MPTNGASSEGLPQIRRWIRIPADKPIVTRVLLGIIAAVFIPALIAPDFYNQMLQWGANDRFFVMHGDWYRLITATFLHAPLSGPGGTPLHILLNSWALFAIGNELEALFGHRRFLYTYALSGLAGSVASFAFAPGASVGASGAIFGLVGALGVYFGLHRGLFGRVGNMQFWNIIIVIAINLAIGFSGAFPIDNSAHVGGLIAGAVVGFVLCPRYKMGEWYNPLVRTIANYNTGNQPWIAAALLSLDVLFLFFVILLLFQQGIMVAGGIFT